MHGKRIANNEGGGWEVWVGGVSGRRGREVWAEGVGGRRGWEVWVGGVGGRPRVGVGEREGGHEGDKGPLARD